MFRIGMIGLVATVAVGLLFACGDKNAPFSPGGSGGGGGAGGSGNPGLDGACGVVNTGVSFAADIQPLLAKSCSCHVTGSTAPLLNNYTNVKGSAEASATAIANGSMPIGGPLSAADQALFQSWLQAGMPNN